MTREDTINRAIKARSVLENEGFTAAIAEVEKKYIKAWRDCPDPEERDRLWLALRLLPEIVAHLKAAEGSGKLEEAKVEKLKRPTFPHLRRMRMSDA